MKKLVLIPIVFLPLIVWCQSDLNRVPENVQVSIGQSLHGTGDSKGFMFSVGYSQSINKLFSFRPSLSASVNSGSFPLFYNSPSGNVIDGSYRFSIGGIQAELAIAWKLLRSQKHMANLSIGPILRYQSSSYYDAITVYYPTITGLPVPVIVLENTSPQNSVAVGGAIAAFYGYKFSNKYSVGINGGFQIDSNSDAILNWGITLVRLLK